MKEFEITRWRSVQDTKGQVTSVTWAELSEMLKTRVPATSKLAARAWSAATFLGKRSAENVLRVSALVLDFDGGCSSATAERAASGLATVIHSSWSHTAEAPRFRLTIQVSRSMTPAEYAVVWAWAFHKFSAIGATPDAACKDASRVWLLPSQPDGGDFFAKAIPGAPLDVDLTLAKTTPPDSPSMRMDSAGAIQTRPACLPPQLEALLQSSHPVRNLWNGKKTSGDTTQSGCDFSFVQELLKLGVSPDLARTSLSLRPGAHRRDDAYIARTVQRALDGLPGGVMEDPPRPFSTHTLSELRAIAEKEPRGWLLEQIPLLPRAGVALIVGSPLAGKSSFCAFVAAAMALETGFARTKVRAGRTLWLAGEHALHAAVSKFDRACAGLDALPEALEDRVTFSRELNWNLDELGDVQRLAGHLEVTQTNLVVIDSFRRFSAGDENSSGDVAKSLKHARILAQDLATGAATRLVVVVHHLGRNGLPRGSTDFKAAVDTTVSLDRRRDGWQLRAEHHTAKPYSCDIRTTDTDEFLRIEELASTSSGARGDLRRHIEQVLRHGPASKAQLRKAVRAAGGGGKNERIDTCIDELVSEGVVVREDGPKGGVVHRLAQNPTVGGPPPCPS